MKLQFMTQESADALGSAIAKNLPAYRTGETASLISSSSARESRVDVEQPPTLISADGKVETDAIAARLIFQWLQKLDVTQASDARLWTYLAHVTFAQYVHKRWGGSLEDSTQPEARASERWFFLGEGSATFFRNGLSRLWWFAYLTYDPETAFELTDVLLSLQDLQQAFLERSLGRCRPLLKTVLRLYTQSEKAGQISGDRGETVKRWAVELNKVGGVYVFDALPADRLEFIAKQRLRTVAG